MNKKLQFYFKESLKTAVSDTLSILFDRSAFVQILPIPIALYITLLFQGQPRMENELSESAKALLAFLLTIPIWFILNLILSPFRTYKKLRELGEFSGNKFIYNKLHQIKTLQTEDNQTSFRIDFEIKDAEPNSLVQFRTLVDGAENRIRIAYGHTKSKVEHQLYCNSTAHIGLRIPQDKKISFFAQIEPNTCSMIVRIYMTSWEI